jgi:transcriptional regulator with XRE-family HTH domain
MMDLAKIGTAIAARRRALHLRQEELAANTGISRSTIARLETGALDELGFNKLMRILAALRLDLRATDANIGRPTLDDLQREASELTEAEPKPTTPSSGRRRRKPDAGRRT